jgi:hypothetical protein
MTRKAVKGNFNAVVPIAARRKELKYSVNTTSLTAAGMVPIAGAVKYPDAPSIYFTREAWVKQCHLVDKCDKEVGWFALVDYDEKYNSFTIYELVIPSQTVTAAETDIGKEDLADAAMELIEAGKDTGKMYAWFHSHVNMGVGPSPQDEYQVEDFLEDLADQPEVPAFIRGIQNKRGDLKIDVYYIQHGVAYQNIEASILYDDNPAWRTDIETEIKTKVTERVYAPYVNTRYNNNNVNTRAAAKKNDRNDAVLDDYDYGDTYDSWDQFYSGYSSSHNTAVQDSKSMGLTPIELDLNAYTDLEVVYNSPRNVEVLLHPDGGLIVCDQSGDYYDYVEYTDVFGELDEEIHKTLPANV